MAELTDRQHQVLVLLLGGATQRDAARQAGIAEETVSRWVNHDDVFRSELARRRLELRKTREARIEALLDKALDALGDALSSDDPVLRLRAARLLVTPYLRQATPGAALKSEHTSAITLDSETERQVRALGMTPQDVITSFLEVARETPP